MKLLIKILMLFVIIIGVIFVIPHSRQASSSFITKIYKTIKLYNHNPPSNNSLPNPIDGAQLNDTWGAARSGGRRHEGVDIFAKRGSPIYSTTEGIVRKVGTDKLGGNVVVIIGPGGVGHYYAHLEGFADISVGDWVEIGDVVGFVGNSGNAKGTPPHLHYGVYSQDGAVNPYPLLIK